MLETFQGWGAIFYPKAFVKAVEKLCKTNDILLSFDEMQSGFGRTGKRFGFEHYEVKPDLICVGKGMGGGVPLSGVIGRGKIMDLPDVGSMSSTHSANPLVCAAGRAVLEELIEKELIQNAQIVGKTFRKSLEEIKAKFPSRISHVLGQGMIMAVLFYNKQTGDPDPTFASKVVERCMQKGLLLVHTGRESIKLGPPLVINQEALLEGVEVFEHSIREIDQE
jgi:4-aminobutyrate aminotransferase-like enzyme